MYLKHLYIFIFLFITFTTYSQKLENYKYLFDNNFVSFFYNNCKNKEQYFIYAFQDNNLIYGNIQIGIDSHENRNNKIRLFNGFESIISLKEYNKIQRILSNWKVIRSGGCRLQKIKNSEIKLPANSKNNENCNNYYRLRSKRSTSKTQLVYNNKFRYPLMFFKYEDKWTTNNPFHIWYLRKVSKRIRKRIEKYLENH